jgi:hypothetical protein
LARISLRCLKVLSPFWTKLLRCCDSSPTHNRAGLHWTQAITMAATLPIDSDWSRRTMRLCCHSSCRPLVVFSCQLVAASPLVVLSLHRPLAICLVAPAGCHIDSHHPLVALPSCSLVAPAGCHIAFPHPLVVPPTHPVVAPAGCASPLEVPPTRRLVTSCCLITSVGCFIIISHRPLVAPPSCPLIMLAGCCVASPCATLSSSHCSPLPTPSNAVKRCCHHQTPPPLKAVSIVHRCHSCCPSPPSNNNDTFVHRRHQTLTPVVATRHR